MKEGSIRRGSDRLHHIGSEMIHPNRVYIDAVPRIRLEDVEGTQYGISERSSVKYKPLAALTSGSLLLLCEPRRPIIFECRIPNRPQRAKEVGIKFAPDTQTGVD